MYRSPAFSGLSFRFAIRCTDFCAGHFLESILSPLRAPSEPEHWYSLVGLPDGRVDLLRDDTTIARLSDTRSAVAWLLWDLNRSVVESTSEHMLFHAGGVEARGRGVLLPAPAGSGKTTLVAALVRAGLGYLSDEVVALSTTDQELLPYPKAMAVKQGSFDALAYLEPFVDPRFAGLSGDQWHLLPAQVREGAVARACEPRFVVVPRYVPDVPATLTPMPAADAFLALVTSAVNLDRHGSRGARLLADLVEHCECYRLELSDLEDACRLMLTLVGGRP